MEKQANDAPEKGQLLDQENGLKANDSVVTESGKSDSKKRKCSTIHLFLVNYSFLLLFYMSQNVYNVGVLRTLERKFGLNSRQSGLIMSMNDISHILVVIFVGYFGKKAHKPRFLSASLSLVALAALFMASPHIFFNSDSSPSKSQTELQGPSYKSLNSDANSIEVRVGNNLWSNGTYFLNRTEKGSDVRLCSADGEEDVCDADDIERDSTNRAAYMMFLAAQFLAGLGGSGITTLGFSYIDENSEKHKSPFYIGITSAVFALGPVSGFGLASLCLRLPEHLGQAQGGGPNDPNWIGCWWLGYVLSTVALAVGCIPMWFFPKHIMKKTKSEEEEKKEKMTIKEQLKEFPKSMLCLWRNAPYMVSVLYAVLLMYMVSGLFVNLPRYFEVHFLQPAYKSSIVAVSGAVSGIVGSFLGGWFMKRKKIKPFGASKIMVISALSSVLCIAINMSLGCPPLPTAGEMLDNGHISVETPCNQNCTCSTSREAYKPVCGEDGLTYFSACHAGCTDLTNGTFRDCRCIPGPEDTGDQFGTATPGLCPVICKMLLPYTAVFFVMSLFGSFSRTPSTIVQFRIVGDEQRAFALGFTSFAVNLLGFVPAPILFGSLIDWSCILWQNTCSASGTGNCILYNSRSFRLITHGSALLFICLATVCTIVISVLVKKMKFPDKTENVDVHQDKQNSDEKEKLEILCDQEESV